MKPLLIKVDKDGNLKITMDELQKMVDSAYFSGYDDGLRDGKKTEIITSPTWPQPNWYTTGTPWWETHKYEVTCSEAKT